MAQMYIKSLWILLITLYCLFKMLLIFRHIQNLSMQTPFMWKDYTTILQPSQERTGKLRCQFLPQPLTQKGQNSVA